MLTYAIVMQQKRLIAQYASFSSRPTLSGWERDFGERFEHSNAAPK
jgi:hypothetical protein